MDGSGWSSWLYVAACIAVPVAWGTFAAWLFARLDRGGSGGARDRQPIDYSI